MTLKNAILATLAYHDIFDYPLTLDEIEKYIIGQTANRSSIEKVLNLLVRSKHVILSETKNLNLSRYLNSSPTAESRAQNGKQVLYALSKRQKIFKLRVARQKTSMAKLGKVVLYANLMKIIPPVKLVAVSGALAMGNSYKNDDIDFVIVTGKNLLWTTRFLANILLLPFKRDPQGQKIANRACLNMFLDESALKIKDQNLYTAHEIAQMKLIWDRDDTYQKLIKSNRWISKYLPNWKPKAYAKGLTSNDKRKNQILNALVLKHLSLSAENLLRSFQLVYMRSKITTEKIADKQLFFHPTNTQDWVLNAYWKRLEKIY